MLGGFSQQGGAPLGGFPSGAPFPPQVRGP